MTYRSPREHAVGPSAARGPRMHAGSATTRLPRPRRRAGWRASFDPTTLRLAFEASPTATIVTDDRQRIVAANPAYERLTGLRRSECLGSTPDVEAIHRDAAAPLAGAGDDKLFAPREAIVHGRDGCPRRVWMSWVRVDTPRGAPRLHVATFSDLGRWDGEFELWRHRARHDALTGLPNRDHLEAELERALARAARHGHRLAVLFIDLDGFKQINDAFGHAAGDCLLARAGLRLRDALRAEDFVARYGGDEFVVLIEAPRQATDAAAAADALLAALRREPAIPSDRRSSISASIGIAMYPEHAHDAAGLLRAADEAMYRAKRSGGHSFAVAAGTAAAPVRLQGAA